MEGRRALASCYLWPCTTDEWIDLGYLAGTCFLDSTWEMVVVHLGYLRVLDWIAEESTGWQLVMRYCISWMWFRLATELLMREALWMTSMSEQSVNTWLLITSSTTCLLTYGLSRSPILTVLTWGSILERNRLDWRKHSKLILDKTSKRLDWVPSDLSSPISYIKVGRP